LGGDDNGADHNVEQLLHAQPEQRGESYQYEEAGATPHHHRARLPLRRVDFPKAEIAFAAHRDLVVIHTEPIRRERRNLPAADIGFNPVGKIQSRGAG